MSIWRKLVKWVHFLLDWLGDVPVSAYSAQAAFFTIISFFPFVMLIMTLVQYLPFTQNELMDISAELIPDKINSFIMSFVNEVYERASGTLIISVTVLTTLWSASSGIISIVKGLNAVYKIRETRNFIKLRIISCFYTLAFLVILLITTVVLIFGNTIYNWVKVQIPILDRLVFVILTFRFVLALIILLSFFLLIYKTIPNRKTTIAQEFPGALFSAVGWIGFSYLYSFYIDNIANFSIYGSLTSVVLFMLWMYICMNIMFLGAQINNGFKKSGGVSEVIKGSESKEEAAISKPE